jgi:DNA-binding MarR family transcriptional regulator
MGEIIRQRLKQNTFSSIQQEALLSLLVTASDLRARFDRICGEQGVSLEQYNILRILKGVYPNGHTCGSIGERMIDRSPDITRRIDSLAKLELVERARSTEDRRVVFTKITPKGLELLDRMNDAIAIVDAELGSGFKEGDWEELIRLCEMLLERSS